MTARSFHFLSFIRKHFLLSNLWNMSSPTVLDIAVVGGGLAGLAAALYLRKSGHRITVCSLTMIYLSDLHH